EELTRGIVREERGHRVVCVLRELLRADDVGRREHAGVAGLLRVEPVPADLRVLLVGDGREAGIEELLDRGEAGGAGADDADGFHGAERPIPVGEPAPRPRLKMEAAIAAAIPSSPPSITTSPRRLVPAPIPASRAMRLHPHVRYRPSHAGHQTRL